MTDIVERLRSSEPLPACPYDKLSPHYWTAPNDEPCAVCGGLNESDAPDLCRGADTRIMGEAADEIERQAATISRLTAERNGAMSAALTEAARIVDLHADEAEVLKVTVNWSLLRSIAKSLRTRAALATPSTSESATPEAMGLSVERLPIGVAASETVDGIKHTYALRANGEGWVYRSRTGPKALWCPIENPDDVPQRFKDAVQMVSKDVRPAHQRAE